MHKKALLAVVAALLLGSTAAIVPSTTFARDNDGGDRNSQGDNSNYDGKGKDDHDWWWWGHDHRVKHKHRDPSVVSVPEPATLALFALGGTVVTIVRRRKRPS